MKKNLSCGIVSSFKSVIALVAVLFFLMSGKDFIQAQEKNYNFGLRGGVGMATLNGFENNGLKLGLMGGAYFTYSLTESGSIIADFNYSMGGQQSEKWIDNTNEKVKEYSKYALHYINLPILYQHYFTDILGLEAGANLRYCFSGSVKTKIGNGSWESTKFSSDDYNPVDFGLILGVFTNYLIPDEDFFVSLRAYFGMLDVIKDHNSNKNVSIQVSVGYMLF